MAIQTGFENTPSPGSRLKSPLQNRSGNQSSLDLLKAHIEEVKKSSNGGVCRIKHLSYDEALTNVMNYYEDWGYDRTIKYLRELSSSGKIPLRFRVRLQDKVVDRCMKPTPRALIRKFNGSSV